MLDLIDTKTCTVIKTISELSVAKKNPLVRHIVMESNNVIHIWNSFNTAWKYSKYNAIGQAKDVDLTTTGLQAYQRFYRYCGKDEIDRMKSALSPLPSWESYEQMHYSNVFHSDKKIYKDIYEFDVNSAFSYGTIKLQDDFDLLKEYMLGLYELKKNATTDIEKSRYKNLQNYLIGYFSRVKKFVKLRSDIIDNSNKNVRKMMKDVINNHGTVYLSNTDSIVTDSAGADVLYKYMGKEIGKLKLSTKTDRLYYKSSNAYQLGDKVVWSGVKYFARKETNFFEDRIAQQEGSLIKGFDFIINDLVSTKVGRVKRDKIVVTVTNTLGEFLEQKIYKME